MSLFPNKGNTPERPAQKSQVQQASEAKVAHESPSTPMKWERPSNLPEIPARDGYVQRWIRTKMTGQDDPQNVSIKFREGWQPRDIKTVPVGFSPPTTSLGQFAGVIGVEGMVLCEMPVEMFEQKRAYVQGRTDMMTQAVEQDIHRINQQNPSNPITAKHKLTVTRGKKVAVPDDEN